MGLIQPSTRISARVPFVIILGILFAWSLGGAAFGDTGVKPTRDVSKARATEMLRQEVYFERNDGQTDKQVMYFTRGFGYSLFLTRDGATIALPGSAGSKSAAGAKAAPKYFRLRFRGANPDAEVSGVEELPGISNYFGGSDPKQWITRVPHFAKVRYANLYPGIDVIFYARDGQLEYDVVASPGADLAKVQLEVEGAKPSLTKEGDVAWSAGASSFTLQKARVYQEGSPANAVESRYALRGQKVTLRVGKYDRSRAVVVDPALIFSTYLSSNCRTTDPGDVPCTDFLTGIAADGSGVYVTGSTNGNVFPSDNPSPGVFSNLGPFKTFVIKIDPTGSTLLYATYLAQSQSAGIAIDSSGAAYVSGTADVQSPNAFPLTSGVFSGTAPASSTPLDIPFATKISADGSQILYSTLLQQPNPTGQLTDVGFMGPVAIAVDSQGAVYVAGNASTQPGVDTAWLAPPVTQGAYETTPVGSLVMKLTPNASGLAYSTYAYGATSAIAVDASGDAFLTGGAGSGFPTTPGAYESSSPSAAGTGFVTELNPTGSGVVYSTYVGDSTISATSSNGIALDSQGEAVVAGVGEASTPSSTLCSSPIGTQLGFGFVTKLNASGTGIVYSAQICGEAGDVALDSNGAAYVSGMTNNASGFQSVLAQAIQAYPPPSSAQYFLKLDASGNLQVASFLGTFSSLSLDPGKIALDPAGNIYVLGSSANFPATPGAVGLNLPGVSMELRSNFLLKIAPSLGAPVPLTTPTSVAFGNQSIETSGAAADVAVGNFGDAPLTTPTISTTGDFSETDDCSGGVAAGAKCDVNVVFTPTATGMRTGTLVFNFGGGIASQTVALSGTGTAPAVTLSPTSLSFGMEPNGTTSGTQQVTVTNGGTGSLVIASIQTSAQFGETNTCGAAIAPVGACTIQVTFTPNASGAQTGTLTITDNAPGSPQVVALAGNQPANFTLASSGGSGASATVAPGQAATYNLSLSGSNGFSGAVNFMCSGAPAMATCTVTPNPANVSGSSATAVMVSVSTTAASVSAPGGISWRGRGASGEFELAVLGLAGFGASVILFGRRRKWAVGMGFAAAALVIFAGCGGGSKSTGTGTGSTGTPAGQYMITVTGASGSITQNMNLMLTVN